MARRSTATTKAKPKTKRAIGTVEAKDARPLTMQERMAAFYATRLEKVEDKMMLVSNSIVEPERVSSGILQLDWMFGGGFVPGMSSIAGQEQTGKCLVGETIVNTNDGFVEMKEVIKRTGFKKPKDMTIVTHKGEAKVRYTYRQKAHILNVTTRSGFSVEGTAEHPMLVLQPNLTYAWKKLSKLQKGDWICTQPREVSPLWGTNATVPLAMATLMGYLTANGQGIRLSSDDQKVVANFVRSANDLDVEVTTVQTGIGKTGAYDLTGSFAKTWLEPLGYTAKNSREKCIPLSVRTAPKEILHEYLESYFECDCGVNGGTISITSASKHLVDQLHAILLMGYGILGSKHAFKAQAHNSATPKLRLYYSIRLAGEAVAQFLSTFKRAKAHKYADTLLRDKKHAGGTTARSVPFVREAVRLAYAAARVSKTPGDSRVFAANGDIVPNYWQPKFSDSVHSGRRDTHWASEYLFNQTDWEQFIPHLGRINPKLASKLNTIRLNDFQYEEVVSVSQEKGQKYVYDFTIPDIQAFIANGLISHNTTAMYHTLATSIAELRLPYSGLYDAEGAVSPKYTGRIWEPFGLDVKELISKAGRARGFYYFRDQVIETMFDYLKQTLSLMPNKNWCSGSNSWAYYFPKRDDHFKQLMAVMDVKPVKSLSTGPFYVCPTENSGPEGFFGVDSFASLLTREEEEKDESGKTRSAMEASEFSKQLKRVKVDLADKKVIMLGTNQLRSHVRAVYGSPDDQEYESGGNALRFYSEARCRAYSRSPSAAAKHGPFTYDKDSAKFGVEDSVEFEGTDRYAYKEFKNTKNKFGKPGLKVLQRVWVSDAEGNPRGVCPAFDVYMHLRNTGQLISQGNKGLLFRCKPSLGKNRAGMLNSANHFKFPVLKMLIVGEYTANDRLVKQACKALGLTTRPNLRKALFAQMKHDESLYSNIKPKNLTAQEEMEDDDSDGVDYEEA